MYVSDTTNYEQVVNFARLVNETPDEDMPSIESYFSKLSNAMDKMRETTFTPLISAIELRSKSNGDFKYRNINSLKLAMSKGVPYLTVAGAMVTRPSNFVGNMAQFTDLYLPGTSRLAGTYVPLLDAYQQSMVETDAKASTNHASHEGMMTRYLSDERKFNQSVSPFFKGGVRDVAVLRDLLPNESAVLTFNQMVNDFINHPLLNVNFISDLESRLSVAATVLENFKNRNSDNPKLYKALARDAFSLAEIANSLVGRGYTIQQVLKLREEVYEIVMNADIKKAS